MGLIASAPGKLVLVGEYAVLFGHPAVVAAVDRRARVALSASPENRCSVTAPGLVSEPVTFTVGRAGACSWDDPARALPLVEGLFAAMGRSGLLAEPPAPFTAQLDTSPFFVAEGGVRRKLGLGSSAALTVALASALLRWGGTEVPSLRSWLPTLVGLHRGLQGGRGSGVDVAASCLGGVVEYSLTGEDRAPRAERLQLPDDLRLVFVWTGRSADTTAFLTRLERSLGSGSGAAEGALERLGAASRAAVGALRRGDPGKVQRTVDVFWEALAELDRVAGLEILSGEHRRLRRAVAECGGSYKPSGAGGGDLGVAFAAGDRTAADVTAAVRAAGFGVVDVGLAASGLEVVPT